jgi:6-phosphogluconate dehydrogenase
VKIGMVGLGRMGSNMVRRLLKKGHECVAFDVHEETVRALANEGAAGVHTLAELCAQLPRPRAIWLMVPAAAVDHVVESLVPLIARDDVLIDGGNSFYPDDMRRAQALGSKGVHYLDVGTSGGVWGLSRGYCLMIGGDAEPVQRLKPVFEALAPGEEAAPRTSARARSSQVESTAERGYLHCGPAGAGHFVKMVHNGIEYGLMAAYAEGLNVLHGADAGSRRREADAESAPLRDPSLYRYNFNLADIVEVWRRGSVVASWILDLAAEALCEDPSLERFAGRVSDSGEGRWTLKAATDEGVPAPILATALAARFSSRGGDELADKVLSALRYQFGGHEEKPR